MRVEFIVPILASLTIAQALPIAGPAGDLKVAPAPVVAQIVPATSGGITVTGRSSRSVKADTVVFVASVQSGTDGDLIATGDAIVAALKKDGIADASWTVQTVSPRFGSIAVSGSSPLAPANALKKLFLDAAAAAGSAVSQNIQLSLQLRNCTAIGDALRTGALDDARHQAEKIAATLGLKLGQPVSANATAFNMTDRCPSENVGPYQGNAGGLAGPWNPDGLLTATSAITVTFAIAK